MHALLRIQIACSNWQYRVDKRWTESEREEKGESMFHSKIDHKNEN